MKIMDGVEMITENLPGMKEMTQIGPGIVAAGVAAARFINRPGVIAEFRVFDRDFSI